MNVYMLACVPEVVVFVLSASMGIWAPINTTYRCLSPTTVTLVRPNVTFSDMMLEAYMPGNDLSPAGTFMTKTSPLNDSGADQAFVVFHHRAGMCGGSNHYCSSYYNNQCSPTDHAVTNSSRNSQTRLLLREGRQRHRVSLGQNGSAAQCQLHLSVPE